ncbi:sulfite oxidase-like oxidoreductase [Lacisediminihabitans profunda]|uniref:Sulfite oxidase-like oxidoreductase n=1 Tax=Lacisediminihabitans profunda TaxID=2594790 RepID=A0A5C8URH8_9MICO|nr:sulfite oxidase-like oxidoreductase [Lacisediminihabitans profunda]TXN30069.1 sulfite oxidase-like oxidoreductase [Lacisediminihabitans profunda]
MGIISRGFSGRSREHNPALPPGQYLTEDFPVLSAGPTPDVDTAEWEFSIRTESGAVHKWDWEQLQALPIEEVGTHIHCVTRWSKLGTSWRGVSLDTLFAEVETSNDYVMAHSYGGYTTNVPLEDLLDGKAWIAFEFDGEPLEAEHGGPARLLIPHLYFWKSAKWIRGLVMQSDDEPGFWEQNGYHLYGDPWLEQRYW